MTKLFLGSVLCTAVGRVRCNPPSTAIYNERRRRVQPIGNTGRVCLRVKVLVRTVELSLKQFLTTAAS